MLYLYDSLKLLHFISAALLLTGLTYSGILWLKTKEAALSRIATLTWALIIPCAVFQLGTGFTLVSLKRAELSEQWIIECVVGFMIAMVSWFSFVYFLLSPTPSTFINKSQKLLLILCVTSLLVLIFLMANSPLSLRR